jgi:site-specific recombinase XerC
VASKPTISQCLTRRNLKAVQKLLGHSTGDIYTDWDIDQLAETLKGMLEDESS